jgi:hypothetical protein
MGLDWLAGNKPKAGHEDEFESLIKAGAEGTISDEMRERFQEISIPSYTQVGAPVVGTDPIASAWVLMRVRLNTMSEDEQEAFHAKPVDLEGPEYAEAKTDEEREALEEMAGYCVLEMAPPCDGLPLYTMGAFGSVDRTSFRGKCLQDCAEIIGDELMDRAYEDLMPKELVAYGETLLEHADRFAATEGCEHIKEVARDYELQSEAESQAHILYAAGRWCVFWGSRGHFLDAWY